MVLAKEQIAVARRARIAGMCGIVGGVLWFASGIVGRFFPQLNEPGTTAFLVSGVVATVSLVLLFIGFLGLAWGGALGGSFGKALFAVAALGYALMVAGGALTVAGAGPLTDPVTAISLIYLLGRLIALFFTLFTAIAILAARRWRGWTAFAPLLLALCPLVGELGFMVAFGQPSQVLNAAWGLFGALLGLATLAQVRSQARPVREAASVAA